MRHPELQSTTVSADKKVVRRLLATVVGAAVVVGSLVPAVPAVAGLPPLAPSVAGHWIYVGWSATKHRIVDVVRLDLINFPLGTLSGTWTEGTAPHYTSLGLNGTECLGCGGPPGIDWNSFDVTGSGDTYTDAYAIRIDNNSGEQLLGGLGVLPPAVKDGTGARPTTVRSCPRALLRDQPPTCSCWQVTAPTCFTARRLTTAKP